MNFRQGRHHVKIEDKMLSIFKKSTISNPKLKPIPGSASGDNTRNIGGFIQKLKETGAKDPKEYCQLLLSRMARELEIIQGAYYQYDERANPSVLRFLSGYACNADYTRNMTFEIGEGLPGQVIKDKKTRKLENVPEGYIIVKTGLGEASPTSLMLIPVLRGNRIIGLLELASFHNFSEDDIRFAERIAGHLAEKFNREK
ncbi:MAG: GAF domain-containing protein [Bacteroidota bacterium]